MTIAALADLELGRTGAQERARQPCRQGSLDRHRVKRMLVVERLKAETVTTGDLCLLHGIASRKVLVYT
jgi:hypothetical protein